MTRLINRNPVVAGRHRGRFGSLVAAGSLAALLVGACSGTPTASLASAPSEATASAGGGGAPTAPTSTGGAPGTPGPADPGASASATPATAPTTTSAPPASAAPTPKPAPKPTPTPAQATPTPGPAGGAIPAGFQPASITFASSTEGWLLGGVPCGGGTCAAILRTLDAGATWASIPAPATRLVDGPPGASTGVSGLRFADANDGWAFGPDVWVTHDGGATWNEIAIGGSGQVVWSLEAARGHVHAIYYDDSGGFRIATSPVDHDAWTIAATTIPFGAGPVPSAQLVLQGAAGWAIEVDRVVVGGARLVGATWHTWTPPCASANGPATLAGISATALVAACDVGVWSTPTGVHAFISKNGGASFAEVARPAVQGMSAMGASTGVIALAGGAPGGSGDRIVASFDSGASWHTVFAAGGSEAITYLGFTTASQGVAIASAGLSGPNRLLMTHDGGHTWAAVPLAP
jgi:hypothetical protein